MNKKIKRIGILTGGGDCPGLNAVIRSIVKTAHNDYNIEVLGFKDGYEGLIENRYVELSPKDVSGLLSLGSEISCLSLGLELLFLPLPLPLGLGLGFCLNDFEPIIKYSYCNISK